MEVDPFVVDQVGVVEVASFNDAHHDFISESSGATGGDVPSQIGIDVGIVGIHVVPLVTEIGVVRNGTVLNVVVELHREHGRVV